MVILQTIGLIITFGVFALLLTAACKMLRELKQIYTQDSGDTDLDLTKKQ